jgi:hypothetical protein
MEGDAIFAKGMTNETGETINLTSPPFIAPGNDEETLMLPLRRAVGGEKASAIVKEIKKLLQSDDDLAERFDYLAVAYHHKGKALLKNLVTNSLLEDASEALKAVYKQRCLRRLYLLDITNTEIKASGQNPVDLYYILLSNPYRIWSLSLEKCETILRRLEKEVVPEDRYCGEIMRRIKSYLDFKWTHVPLKMVLKEYPDFSKYQEALVRDYGLVVTKTYVALEKIVAIEKEIALLIKTLLERPLQKIPDEEKAILEEILEQHRCDEDQKKAIVGILEQNIAIVTGGAGTGKTTLLKALVDYLKERGRSYLLGSFTGKAVSRIKQVVPDSSPATLHRLIGRSKKSDEDAEAEAFDYFIIDESSMLESKLFYDFTRAYPQDKYHYKIIFIGDMNQLSPIGWGCLFQQIIKSQKVPTYYLTQCHRIEGEGAVANSRLLLEGNWFEEKPDFRLCFGKSPLSIIKEESLAMERVRVLAPFVETVEGQNKQLQELFASNKPYLEDYKGKKWYLGDRVMMTKNNYTIEVMNGQEGQVVLHEEEGITVHFEGSGAHRFSFRNDDLEKILSYYPPSSGRYLDLDTCEEITPAAAKKKKYTDETHMIACNSKDLYHNFMNEISNNNRSKDMKDKDESSLQVPPVDHLIHSYALTVHKAQGSEWDYVIVYLPKREKISTFITRQLLYTAVTRAKKGVFCLGDRNAWLQGILNSEKEPKQLLVSFITAQ